MHTSACTARQTKTTPHRALTMMVSRLLKLSVHLAIITLAESSITTATSSGDKLDEHSCGNTDLDGWRETMLEYILADDYQALDSSLPGSVAELKKRGAHRCWHKHSTFLEHLLGVHNMLRLWGQGQTAARVGLFHSAYSNSYVNLALFDPSEAAERQTMKRMVGEETEGLVHLFCIIDRQSVVVNTLLKGGFIPKDGISVPHLRNPDEQVYLSAETLRMLVVFTMADIGDQYFGWQDRLFGGDEMVNSMLLPGDHLESHESTAMWPGKSQPGLYMSYLSRLGAVARTFVPSGDSESPYGDRVSDFPPIFDNCTKVLSRENEAKARDLYWSVVMGQVQERAQVTTTLELAIECNPWAFEPLVMLAQHFLHQNEFEAGEKAAAKALTLQKEWGTAWDKRLSLSAWVAWTRVMHQRAEDKLDWPVSGWDVNNFGLVR